MKKSDAEISLSTLTSRVMKPKKPFWRKMRNLGIAIAGIGGSLLAAPVALPAALVTIGGYLVTAGTTITAISQLTKDDNNDTEPEID